MWRGQGADQLLAFERSLAHARRLRDRWDAQFLLAFVAEAYFLAPRSATDLLAWLDQHGSDNRASLRIMRGVALVMVGRVTDALAVLEAERATFRAQGKSAEPALEGQRMSFIAVRAGRLELAEEILADACRSLEAQGEHGVFSTSAARRAVVLAELGRLEEAETWAAKAIDASASDDLATHIIAKRALAKVRARRGEAGAEQLARDALDLALTTDFLCDQADTYADLADVLERAGQSAEATEMLHTAITLYHAKGDVTGEAAARARADALDRVARG
jgi:tetratricopeptide (TPR) repeat protein